MKAVYLDDERGVQLHGEEMTGTQDSAVSLLIDRMLTRAKQVEESASGMMRASAHALAEGDINGAAREHVIAAREYRWASWLYLDAARGRDSQRCAELSDAVLANEWRDPDDRVKQ